MYRSFRRAALAAALFSAVVGCTRTMVQNKQQPDPLLVSKKPVEGKPSSFSDPRSQAPVFTAEDAAGRPAAPVQLSSELVVRPDR
jgi:hypothetical protein